MLAGLGSLAAACGQARPGISSQRPGPTQRDAAIVAIEDGQQAMANELRVGGQFPRLTGADSGNAGRVGAGDHLGRRQVREQRRDSGGQGLVAGL